MPAASSNFVHCRRTVPGRIPALASSKLNGAWQLISTTLDLYNRPIETPIHNLRPARETCEKCHWPEKFYTENLHFQRHYLSDEENTPWNITLRMKIGAAHEALGLIEGIHWHINSNVKIEYIAEDEKHEIQDSNRNPGGDYYTQFIAGSMLPSYYTENRMHIASPVLSDLERVSALKEKGFLSEEEFNQCKSKLLKNINH